MSATIDLRPTPPVGEATLVRTGRVDAPGGQPEPPCGLAAHLPLDPEDRPSDSEMADEIPARTSARAPHTFTPIVDFDGTTEPF